MNGMGSGDSSRTSVPKIMASYPPSPWYLWHLPRHWSRRLCDDHMTVWVPMALTEVMVQDTWWRTRDSVSTNGTYRGDGPGRFVTATWQCEYQWHLPRWWSRRICDGHVTVWVPMALTEALVQEALWRPRDCVSTHDTYRGAGPGGFVTATWLCEYLWHLPRRWSRRLCDGHVTVWVPMILTEALIQEALWRPRDCVSTYDTYRGADPGGFVTATWLCEYLWYLPRRWSRKLCDGHVTVWVPITLTEVMVQEALWRPRENVSTYGTYRGAGPGCFVTATWQCEYLWHLPRRWSRRLCDGHVTVWVPMALTEALVKEAFWRPCDSVSTHGTYRGAGPGGFVTAEEVATIFMLDPPVPARDSIYR